MRYETYLKALSISLGIHKFPDVRTVEIQVVTVHLRYITSRAVV